MGVKRYQCPVSVDPGDSLEPFHMTWTTLRRRARDRRVTKCHSVSEMHRRYIYSITIRSVGIRLLPYSTLSCSSHSASKIQLSKNIMNDPFVSSLQAPPPRYLLESDSSDEEGQGSYLSSSRKSAEIKFSHDISFQIPPAVRQPANVIVCVGQVGRYLIRKCGPERVVGEVLNRNGNSVVGRAIQVDDGLMFIMEVIDSAEGAIRIAEELLSVIKARDWFVLLDTDAFADDN